MCRLHKNTEADTFKEQRVKSRALRDATNMEDRTERLFYVNVQDILDGCPHWTSSQKEAVPGVQLKVNEEIQTCQRSVIFYF